MTHNVEQPSEPVKKKRKYQCQMCGDFGHNIRSCEMQQIRDMTDYYDYYFE